MNELSGNKFLFEMEDPTSPGDFVTLGGLTTNSLAFNKEQVDVTTKDSEEWRKLLNGTGLKTADFSGEGVAQKVNTLKYLLDAYKNSAHINARLSMKLGDENVLQITVLSEISSFEFTGEQNQSVTYSISVVSAGVPDIQIF